MAGGTDGLLVDEGLRVWQGPRPTRVPWAEVEAVLPMIAATTRRRPSSLALLRDGSARRLSSRAAATAREHLGSDASLASLEGATPHPLPPTRSAFPRRQPLAVVAAPLFVALATIEILLLAVVGDAAQGRLDPTPPRVGGLVALLAWAALMGIVVPRSIGRSWIAVRPEGLEVSTPRRRELHPWASIERVTWFPTDRRFAELAAVIDGTAREIPLTQSGRAKHERARALAEELELARHGTLAPPRSTRRRRPGAAVACLGAAVLLLSVAIAGELDMAARAEAIRTRAEHVDGLVIADRTTGKTRELTYRIAGDPDLHMEGIGRPDKLVITDGRVAALRDPETGAVWLDGQVRWPPTARGQKPIDLADLTLLWLAPPALAAAAFALLRREPGGAG